MKRAEIRKHVAGHLAALGYPREWFEWPKNKPGQIYLMLPDDAIHVYRLAAPMPRYKLREALAKIPRRGPALVYKRVTPSSWRQPDFEERWATPADDARNRMAGHKGDSFGPPTRADVRGKR
jgi:hypothetical protein